jgi:hypothetical protein
MSLGEDLNNKFEQIDNSIKEFQEKVQGYETDFTNIAKSLQELKESIPDIPEDSVYWVRPRNGDCSSLIQDACYKAREDHQIVKLFNGKYPIIKGGIKTEVPIIGEDAGWDYGTVLQVKGITDGSPVIEHIATDLVIPNTDPIKYDKNAGEYWNIRNFAIIKSDSKAVFTGIKSNPVNRPNGYHRFNFENIYISGAETGMDLKGQVSNVKAFIKDCKIGFKGHMLNAMRANLDIEKCPIGISATKTQGSSFRGMIEGCGLGLEINDYSYDIKIDFDYFEGYKDSPQTHMRIGYLGAPCFNITVFPSKFVYDNVIYDNKTLNFQYFGKSAIVKN